MVKANASWHSSQHSYWQLPDLNCMSALLETRQQECLPLPESTVPCSQNPRTERRNEANGQLRGFPSNFLTSHQTKSPYLEGKKSALPCCLDGMADLNANFPAIRHNGFVIFDQSENQTRLICNYFCPAIRSPITANAKVVSGYKESHTVGHEAHTDQIDSAKDVLLQASAANNDESEMHEDTDEINALLDSDDDDDGDEIGSGDKCDDEDDEVTSTDHSPFQMREELVSELVEEVASSDSPNKRLKKLDGGYSKSSPMYTASSVKLDETHEYENNAKSGYYADGLTGIRGSDSTFGNNGLKKDKIREILKVLGSIIPGVKGKDPLFVIDEAIDYLRIAKVKAETLGVSFH